MITWDRTHLALSLNSDDPNQRSDEFFFFANLLGLLDRVVTRGEETSVVVVYGVRCGARVS